MKYNFSIEKLSDLNGKWHFEMKKYSFDFSIPKLLFRPSKPIDTLRQNTYLINILNDFKINSFVTNSLNIYLKRFLEAMPDLKSLIFQLLTDLDPQSLSESFPPSIFRQIHHLEIYLQGFDEESKILDWLLCIAENNYCLKILTIKGSSSINVTQMEQLLKAFHGMDLTLHIHFNLSFDEESIGFLKMKPGSLVQFENYSVRGDLV